MPTGNLPDPNLEEKLSYAFGPEPGPDDALAEAYHQGFVAATKAAAEQAEEAESYPQDLPEISIRRGGIQFPTFHPGVGLIYSKLIEVSRKVGAVGKDGLYDQGGTRYNFRGIDAVTNALHPVMSEVGVFVVPTVRKATYRDTMTTGRDPRPTREVTVEVCYRFYAEDGSFVDAVVPGESLDQSDKGSAKALSVALRIALLQVFTLPTSEPDPDASYNTRDGAGAMSAAVRNVLLAQAPKASIPELAPLWAVVLEHSAAERALGLTTITWADYFAQRIAEIIEAIETSENGLARYEELKVSPLRHLRYQGKEVTVLMSERGAFIKQRAANAFDQHVTAVGNAQTLEELDAAHVAMNADYDAYLIGTQQKIDLLEIIGDKKAKLERELNQAGVPTGADDNAVMLDEPSGAES